MRAVDAQHAFERGGADSPMHGGHGSGRAAAGPAGGVEELSAHRGRELRDT